MKIFMLARPLSKLIACLAALALALACPQLRATDFHVATAQGLQNALTQSANNGVNNNIYIAKGYYAGSFNYNSSGANNLTVLPETGFTNTDITMDGAGGGRALNISSSAALNTITIQGITFLRNCGNAQIGALRIAGGSAANIFVTGCQFLSPANSSGMGLEIASGLNCNVIGCGAIGSTSGGGGRGISISGVTSVVNLQGCVMLSNTVPPSVSFAAGFFVSGNLTTTVLGNTISGNSSGADPAAIINQDDASASVTFSANTVTGNSAFYGAVGVAIGGGTATISSNNFIGNTGLAANAVAGGALTCTARGNATFFNNTFTSNSAAALGAAVCVMGATTTSVSFSNNTFVGNYNNIACGGLYINAASATLVGNKFIGNWSASAGGGLYCSSATTVSATANTFSGNSAAGQGAGIYCSALTINFSDNLVVGNLQTSASSTGGGVWVNTSSNLFFINNTITGNYSAGGGGGAAFQINGLVEVLNVYNNIIWGNSGSPGADVWLGGNGQERVFCNNDAHDLLGIWDLFENNLDVNPQFVAPASGNYHLQKGSPCLDAGTTAAPSLPAVDLDGNPRIVGGTVDLGCYELSAPVPLMVSLNLPSTGGVKLQWPSSAGANYIVQESTDLKQGFHNWTGTLPATPPVNTWSDVFVPGAAAVFYRIIVQ